MLGACIAFAVTQGAAAIAATNRNPPASSAASAAAETQVAPRRMAVAAATLASHAHANFGWSDQLYYKILQVKIP